MNKTLLLLLVLVIAMSATAHTRPLPESAKATTQSARKPIETRKTRDGREIRPYDDMSYEALRSSASFVPDPVTLNIKAGIITNTGELKPVANREFLVFTRDIESILAAVNDRQGKPLNIFSFHLADEYREVDEGRVFNAALDTLKSITVATFTTDFQGNAAVQLPYAGASYWIYGSTQRVGRSSCWWYREIVPSRNYNLVFDNNNAAYCG